MIRRCALTVLAALLFNAAHSDAESAGVEEPRFLEIRAVSDHGKLILVDNRQVCLSNIWLGGHSLSSAQKVALKKGVEGVIGGRMVRIDHQHDQPTFDRYGCLSAIVETEEGISLQEALLQRGLAMVQPSLSSMTPGDIDGWLAIEEKARRAGLGLWRDHRFRPKKAKALVEHIGKTNLVEGRVVRTSSNDRYTYLNFGRDWRTDFTVRIRNKLLKQGGIEPDHFDGKQLRVRGFVQEARGPLIDISHLKQIEVMP
jgi:hypothetical protein